ncbi:MAG: MBL fold metallo-hydrolase [Elusimicrobia bacterium]|nr:MBL fold metallo-hydrolase [Elusimicrobiota bacterium]
MPELLIRQIELGPMANFIYLAADSETKEALVIDPAWDAAFLRLELAKLKWKLSGIFLTHHHFDHTNGAGAMARSGDVSVYVHQDDAPALDKALLPKLKILSGAEEIALGSQKIAFLHTPGHTEGSLCLKAGGRIFTGDTLFVHGCGRVDLPGSDPEKMFNSLRLIAGLDDKTLILPGHNYGPTPTSTIGEEKKSNPYLKHALTADFAQFQRAVAG